MEQVYTRKIYRKKLQNQQKEKQQTPHKIQNKKKRTEQDNRKMTIQDTLDSKAENAVSAAQKINSINSRNNYLVI